MKRIVFIGDGHSGHRAGLIPPTYQYKKPYPDEDPYLKHEYEKYAEVQKLLWDFITEWAKKLQPIYALVYNGDAIEGKGRKSGGRELISSDRDVQCSMASQVIKMFKPKHVLMTFGTNFHTGYDEDWERQIAKDVSAEKIADMLWFDINGLRFNVRHKVSRSVIPHGRATPILRQHLWEKLWADWEERKAASVLIRHHVHYHTFAGGPDHLVMTGPGLQAYSQYGVRQCEGIVHMGLVWFDVDKHGSYRWESKIIAGKLLKSKPLVL